MSKKAPFPPGMTFKPARSLTKPLKEALKSLAFKYTKLGAPTYPYNLEPIQLALLINEIERLKSTNGNILEIGVARGMTTRFLCQHIRQQKIEHTLRLYAIDTFSSFTQSDLDFEVSKRGKDSSEMKGFAYNDYDIWAKHFSEYPFLEAIKADCSTLDYSIFSPIKLALLDVDLYLPTKNTLPKLYDSLAIGGAIVVDDVMDNATYDGAYQAFVEFCDVYDLAPKIIGNKCGVIYKLNSDAV